LHIRIGRAVQHANPRSFTRGIGNNLLNHNHPAVFNHAEYQQEEYGRDDSELDGGCASSVSSASSAEVLHWQINCQ
jgi:hypothetical protein